MDLGKLENINGRGKGKKGKKMEKWKMKSDK